LEISVTRLEPVRVLFCVVALSREYIMAVNPEWRRLLLEAINEAAVGITDELGASAVTFSGIKNDRMRAVLSGHFELVLK
jgi:hypothetical protein